MSQKLPICTLCRSEMRPTRIVGLSIKIVDGVTLRDAINQQIDTSIFNFDLSETSLACKKCFNYFKSFYDFLEKIKTSTAVMIKNENFIEIPTEFVEPQDSIKAEPNLQPLVKIEPLTAVNYDISDAFDQVDSLGDNNDVTEPPHDDSDFEWSYDEELDSMDSKTNHENAEVTALITKPLKVNPASVKSLLNPANLLPIPPQRQPSVPSAPPVDIVSTPAANSWNYIRYLPRAKVTKEMIDSGQDFIVIDGIRYKIPRRPIKAKNKNRRREEVDDMMRRPHASCDPEGEAKIRSYTDIKCYHCNVEFETFFRMKKHFKQFHPTEKAYLLCCDRKFYRRFEMLDHIEFHDKSVVHSCQVCKKIYKSRGCLKSHMRYYHSDVDKRVICDHCGKICNNEVLLKAHALSHVTDATKTFQCYICKDSREFLNILRLKNHLRAHHPIVRKSVMTVCHICSATVRASYINAHMLRKHGNKNRRRVQCEICSIWILEDTARAHQLKHSDMGITCTVCGKFLKSRYSLSIHMKHSHEKNYTFNCDQCGKGFFRLLKLREHIAARHTREFLFKCGAPGCDRQFRAEGNWKIHEKRHHPEWYDKYSKPFYRRNPEELAQFEEMVAENSTAT